MGKLVHAYPLREFSDELAQDFHDINEEWIEAMFVLETVDREVLENPRAKIIDAGRNDPLRRGCAGLVWWGPARSSPPAAAVTS